MRRKDQERTNHRRRKWRTSEVEESKDVVEGRESGGKRRVEERIGKDKEREIRFWRKKKKEM